MSQIEYNPLFLIHAENETRKVLNHEIPRIKAILTPFIGQQIYKKDFSLLKKIKDLITFDSKQATPFKSGGRADIMIYLNCSEHSLYLTGDICFSGGSYEDRTNYCYYYKIEKWVGSIEKLSLKELTDITPFELLEYSEQIAQLEKVKTLKAQYEQEENKLFRELKRVI